MIPIVFCGDNNYIEYILVTMVSILENTHEKIKFYIIIDKNVQIKKIKKIKFKIKKYQNAEIEIIEINKKLTNKFKTNGHLISSAYYRIFIPKYVKENKVIYLDGDLIVLKNIKKLYNIDINNYIIGAVESPTHIIDKKENLKKHKELNIPLKYKYFNSGVLLINCKRYRFENIELKLKRYIIKNPEKLKLCDQDALNAVLY
ncbi:MAG: glycosyltransferase [Candidatus ainarchaeum sp.]|nr:glycosyltransferase [Candidatus ainarchaeum sp.]MDD4220868.1 glycosyltransferase [Candidatus ainarchaeum sp.]MDD4662669.1 glycosyltransferase [Candidatus ainarchaeum sp.]